jgi:periplasmic protein TonB
MKYQFKAFQLSLAFHAVMIFFIIGFSSSFARTSRVIVIDFSIEDSINTGNEGAGTLNAGRTKTKFQPIHRELKRSVKTIEPEPKKKEEQIMETRETIAPVQTLDSQAQTSEAQVPVMASAESIDSQYKTEQAIQANFLTSSGNGLEGKWGDAGLPGKGTRMASSGGYENDSDVLRQKKRYLKENFSYIRDLIQKKAAYPKLAKQMGLEGKVIVSFIVNSNGHAKDIKLMNSSGIEILDRSSIEAVKDASPFPKPPVEAQLIIPISYKFR